MAVEARKSNLITQLDATPPVPRPLTEFGGRLKSQCNTVEAANADSIGTTMRILRCHSSWRVEDLILDADDIGTTTVSDFGLYRTSADGGAVVDADFFASAVVLNAGAVANSLVTRESGVIDIANKHKRIWEQLGLTSDPNLWYDIVATLTAAADAAGTITLTLRYVDGN